LKIRGEFLRCDGACDGRVVNRIPNCDDGKGDILKDRKVSKIEEQSVDAARENQTRKPSNKEAAQEVYLHQDDRGEEDGGEGSVSLLEGVVDDHMIEKTNCQREEKTPNEDDGRGYSEGERGREIEVKRSRQDKVLTVSQGNKGEICPDSASAKVD
jgi:hypothetical protein